MKREASVVGRGVFGNGVDVDVDGVGWDKRWRKLTLRKKIQTDVNGWLGVGGNQTKAIEFVDRCSTIQYLTAYVRVWGKGDHIWR